MYYEINPQLPGHYPKRKYAHSGGSVEVYNIAEEKALGDNWTDSEPAPLEDADDDNAPDVFKPRRARKSAKE